MRDFISRKEVNRLINCTACSQPLTEGGIKEVNNKKYMLLYCVNPDCKVFVVKVTQENIDKAKKEIMIGAMGYGKRKSCTQGIGGLISSSVH